LAKAALGRANRTQIKVISVATNPLKKEGKKGDLLVFKRITKNYASAFHQRVNQHFSKKEQSHPPAESDQFD
jgi:hypothetical protein